MDDDLTLNDVLNAYANGLFPMAESAGADEFYWYDPPMRGQLALAALHIPGRLRRTVKQFPYEIRTDTAFEAVIETCAESQKGRAETWINAPIRDLFIALHEAGFAHSVECWKDGQLVGGVYGLALGGAFMGESMFSRERDASKIALIHLCARLWKAGFTVLDTQFINDHLKQFGVYEIPKEEYLQHLHAALENKCDFGLQGFLERTEKDLVCDYLSGPLCK